jgi:hypothetical protein
VNKFLPQDRGFMSNVNRYRINTRQIRRAHDTAAMDCDSTMPLASNYLRPQTQIILTLDSRFDYFDVS